MSPKIFRLTPLVAALPFCAAAAHAETLSYYASPDANEPTLSFNTNCAVSDLDFNKSLRKLTCPSGTTPPAPTCSSFGAISASMGLGSTPARVLDARRGDTLLFVGSCAKGSGSTSNVPLSYQLLPNDGDTPVATSLTAPQFAITVPATAEIGSYVTYRLRAEQAGATSGSLSATYKVVDAPINPPQNCAVSGSPSNSWITGNTPATFSVGGCTSLSGNVAYRWLVNGSLQSGQTGTSLSSSALTGLGVGNHTITAQVCNDPSQAGSGGSSCATPSASASVVAQNVTPTPACSIVPSVSLSSAVPSGSTINFSLSCSNTGVTGYNTSYAWTRDSSSLGPYATASSTFSNTGTAEVSSTVAVTVCNTPAAGGTAVCQSPTPSVTVRVSPAVVTNPNAPKCQDSIAGISRTIFLEHNLENGNLNLDGMSIQPMTGSDAFVVAFTTPATTSSARGSILAGGPLQSSPSKLVTLGTVPCSQYGANTTLAWGMGQTTTNDWGLGSGGAPVLQPSTTYYVTVLNRYYSNGFVNSCTPTQGDPSTVCATKLSINRP